MKTILIILTALFLVSCSSAPTVDNGSEKTAKGESKKTKKYSSPVVNGEHSKSSHKTNTTLKSNSNDEKEDLAHDEDLQAELTETIKKNADDSSLKLATQILYQDPSDMRAQNTVAMINFKKGKYKVAEHMLLNALQAHPNQSELHSNLGLVHLMLGEKKEAIKSFRKAIEQNENNIQANANLGAIYVKEKDYAKGMIVLEKAYLLGNREVSVINNYGVALMANAKYEKAHEVFKSGMGMGTTQKDLLFNFSILLVEHMGKPAEGLEVINRLKFVGMPQELKQRINALENKAKSDLK